MKQPNKQGFSGWKLTPEWIAIGAILMVATILRFYDYSGFSFSNDELSAINRLRVDTFSDLVKYGFFVDGHPGGIQVFLWYWSKIFGITEASLRFPFVIFGIGSVWFSYLVAKRMFGTVAGLFTSASLAFLQFPLLYSQIARPYSSGLFFGLLMVYFWLRIVQRKESETKTGWNLLLDFSGYLLATSLCMYNHYFSFLMAVMVGISGFFFIQRSLLKYYIGTGVLAVLLFLPHLAITLNHLTFKGVGLWLGKPHPTWVLGHLNYILNDSVFAILTITFSSILVSWQGKMLKNEKGMMSLALAWFFIPMIIGFIYSILVSPVLQHPVLIFTFPFIIMLLFMGGGNHFGKVQQILLGIYLVLGIFGTLFVNRYYSSQHFGEFKDIAETTKNWEKKFGAGNMDKVVITNSPYYLDYYFDRMKYETSFELYHIQEDSDYQKLDSLLTYSNKPYFIYAWTKPSPEGVEDIIRSAYPWIVESIQYGKYSKITLFGKKEGTLFEPGLQLTRLYADSNNFKANTQQEAEKDSDSLFFKFTPEIEFSPAIERKLDDFKDYGALKIIASVDARLSKTLSGAMLVISIDSEDGKSVVWKSLHFDKAFTSEDSFITLSKSMDIEGELCTSNKIKAYIWNPGKKTLQIDNLKLSIFRYDNHNPFDSDQEKWGSKD
ncbi:MAG: glycosyltransferase family 39 protein [Bacteroidales bacterium]|nr:glycosyltransferase family 39 protein [Bacteroidales bacterium]